MADASLSKADASLTRADASPWHYGTLRPIDPMYFI